jgi:hypothetical protein
VVHHGVKRGLFIEDRAMNTPRLRKLTQPTPWSRDIHGGLLCPTVITFQTLAASREAENALKDEDRCQAIQEFGCYQSEGQESNVDFDLV